MTPPAGSSSDDTVQVVAADRLARALVAGFGLCDEAGLPLAERQKIALLTGALLEFDGVQVEAQGLGRIERLLSAFGSSNGDLGLSADG